MRRILRLLETEVDAGADPGRSVNPHRAADQKVLLHLREQAHNRVDTHPYSAVQKGTDKKCKRRFLRRLNLSGSLRKSLGNGSRPKIGIR